MESEKEEKVAYCKLCHIAYLNKHELERFSLSQCELNPLAEAHKKHKEAGEQLFGKEEEKK